MEKIARIIIAGVVGATIGGVILLLSPFCIGFGAFRQSLMHLGSDNWPLPQSLLTITFCAAGSFLVDLKDWGGRFQSYASSLACGLWAVFFIIFVKWINHYQPNNADIKPAAWLIAISYAVSWGVANYLMRYWKLSARIEDKLKQGTIF